MKKNRRGAEAIRRRCQGCGRKRVCARTRAFRGTWIYQCGECRQSSLESSGCFSMADATERDECEREARTVRLRKTSQSSSRRIGSTAVRLVK